MQTDTVFCFTVHVLKVDTTFESRRTLRGYDIPKSSATLLTIIVQIETN